MKYLDKYYKWMKAGVFPPDDYSNGICGGDSYWGVDEDIKNRHIAFTPLRQNIVLFLAAMNNEL